MVVNRCNLYGVWSIDGTIPSELSKLHKLSELYLQKNDLGACICFCVFEGGKGCRFVGSKWRSDQMLKHVI